jgi:outer membrane lipoprotein carrier protein
VELAVAIAMTSALAATQPAASPDELLRRLERRQQSVGDLTARFVQSYRSGMLGDEVVERGRLSLKRPGRMLWEYQQPEKKTFVADGRAFYFYVPADRQVIVRDQEGGERGVAMMLLSGRESLSQQFRAEAAPAPAGVTRLRLLPRKPDPDVEQLEVDLDEAGRIRAIRLKDVQGNESRFAFDDIRENVGLQDRLFRFEVPAGVEVVRG